MKKIIPYIVLVISLFLVSCGTDEIDNAEELKLEKTDIYIEQGTTASITINSSNGGEKSFSKNEDIAVGKIVGKTIEITGLKIGEVTIIVTDIKNKNVTIKVNVIKKIASLKLNHTKIALLVGNTANISITNGSDDFSVTSSNQTKVTAKIDKRTVTISGVALGESTITVIDNKTRETVSISVSVRASIKLEISKDNFINYNQKKEVRIYNYNPNSTVNTAERKRKLINITSGSGMYSVTVKDDGTRFITAKIENGNVLIQSKSYTSIKDFGEFNIRILDEITKQSEEIKVRVLNPLAVDKTDITVSLDENSEYITFNNFPVQCKKICTIDYISIKPNDKSILSIEKGQTPASSYQGFRVLGKALGTTKVILSDGVRDDIEVSVTVVKGTLLVRTDDATDRKIVKNDIINLSTDTSISFNITGSNDYKTTYTPDNLITEKFIKGNNTDNISKLTLNAGSSIGEVKVTITDNATGEKNNFTINIQQGNVYNCDKNGKFKYEIDYKGVKHDSAPIVVKEVKPNESPRELNCLETITMKVGEVIDVKFCGGYVNGTYDIYQQYMIGGDKRKTLLDIFNSEDKLQATSTIKALKAGELVIIVLGYKKIDPSVGYTTSTYKYYKVIIK